MHASLVIVANTPAAATAKGWWPSPPPPRASFAASYAAKYSACAGLIAGSGVSGACGGKAGREPASRAGIPGAQGNRPDAAIQPAHPLSPHHRPQSLRDGRAVQLRPAHAAQSRCMLCLARVSQAQAQASRPRAHPLAWVAQGLHPRLYGVDGVHRDVLCYAGNSACGHVLRPKTVSDGVAGSACVCTCWQGASGAPHPQEGQAVCGLREAACGCGGLCVGALRHTEPPSLHRSARLACLYGARWSAASAVCRDRARARAVAVYHVRAADITGRTALAADGLLGGQQAS